jgi:hypothetical protein
MTRTLASLALLFAVGGIAVAEEGQPLKLEAVDQVIEQSDRAVQACGRGARNKDVRAINLRLEIDAEGHVVAADVAGKPSSESQCLQRVAKRLHFPATGTVTHVEYPFMLVPQLRR